MQKPFPELTDLCLHISFVLESRLPDSFLGGTTPRLRSLELTCVSFPGIPNLLLSATHLVNLDLFNIPRSGYIPPEAMAACLSALTSLEFLRISYQYPPPRSSLESRRPPPSPLTRSILHHLTKIQFRGASEYSEEIWAWIGAPRLEEMRIDFFDQITFDTPQLFQFISRRPALTAPEMGHIASSLRAILVKFPSQTSDLGGHSVEIPSTVSEGQLSSLEQVCTSSFPPLSALEDFYTFKDMRYAPEQQADVENTILLDFLRSFVAVKDLYLTEEFVLRIAPALQELVRVGGRTTKVLPALENIFLDGFQPSGPLHGGIEMFVAARRLTSHPVAVFRWDKDSRRQKVHW